MQVQCLDFIIVHLVGNNHQNYPWQVVCELNSVSITNNRQTNERNVGRTVKLIIVHTHNYLGLVARKNLSSGFPSKRVSNRTPQLQRLARKLIFSCSQVKYGTFQKANNKGADQTARMYRLVCACVVCKPTKTGFLASRPQFLDRAISSSVIHSLGRMMDPPLYMGTTQINEFIKHKHLGLIFSSDATWTEHIAYIVERAWKRIGSLRRNKFMLDRLSLLKLYMTYIRSLLEYANIIWDNCSIENKRNLESIQIEAARIITGATKLCSIQKLYDDTGIQTLQKRRNNHKLFQLYKILNGLTPQYLQSLIPQRVQNIST